MKIIKSLLLIAIASMTVNSIQAQEIKTMIAPARVETAIPKVEHKPSAAPVFKPQPGVGATKPAAAVIAETPSPFKKDVAAKTSNISTPKTSPIKAEPVTEAVSPVTQTQMQPAHLQQQKN